jgi:glutaredoxin
MYILRMYVLEGCPSCQQAVNFMQSKQLPCEIILANNDPIIKAGNEQLNNGVDNYPVFMCNMTKDIVVGFKLEEYERITQAVSVLFRNGTWNVNNSGQPTLVQNTPPSAEAATGTN